MEFILLLTVWAGMCAYLANRFRKYGDVIVPLFLILAGGPILWAGIAISSVIDYLNS